MSLEARQALVAHPHTIFRSDTQRADLLDPNKTQTYLIAMLAYLIEKGHIVLFTAICSDHAPDAWRGEHCHQNGWCADVWPLASVNATDYIDASDSRFERFLRDAAAFAHLHQIGLAGSAATQVNFAAAGPTAFQDGGADHIHLGAQ